MIGRTHGVRAASAPRLRRSIWSAFLLFCGALAFTAAPRLHAQAKSNCPPVTRTDNVVDDYHGVKVADPYRWLEDQTSPETRAWIDAEERCTEAALRNLSSHTAITKILNELYRVDSFGTPIERNGRYFYMKRTAAQDLSVLWMRTGASGREEVLVDPHPLSPDHSTSVLALNVSEDGSLLAYGVRAGGEDELTVHFLDTATKKDLPDLLPRADYFSMSILPDRRGVYYARMNPDGPRIHYHSFGSPASGDTEIFGKGYGKDKILFTEVSEEGRYLLIGVSFGTGSSRIELYLQDLQQKTPVRPLVNDTEAVFLGAVAGGQVYVFTNWKAPHWRVFAVDPAQPARENWRLIIPESEATIESVVPAGGRLLVQYTENASSRLKLFEPDGTPAGEISLPALGAVSGISGRWKSRDAFFAFASFNIPSTIYQINVATRAPETWAAPKVPINSTDFNVQQVWYSSKDGTRVPMFLFFKKGLERNGNNPALLTGYGGFDLSETPRFSPLLVAWAARGGVVALANLRGGNEFGEAWHRAGMLEKKQNVFDDFLAAAQWLIAQKYTSPARLAIQGSSNGGLLVGAALTQHPELFRAVVCGYPLEDMLRYHKFLDGPFWVPEYGSSENPAQFKYLYAYSPYHNVKPGAKFPAVLFVTGDGDTRVAPLHARKMAARLQAASASDLPVLLLYDTKSGHSGGRPVAKQIEENADILSFLYWQLGVKVE